jgi:hypothetical protein
VNATLKRVVFKPLLKAGVGPIVAGLLTFLCSGAFHEYQFVLSFDNYAVGRAGAFFLLQGLLLSLETGAEKALGKHVAFLTALPQALKTFFVLIVFSPTIPLFSMIWIDEGMYDAVARLAPAIRVRY